MKIRISTALLFVLFQLHLMGQSPVTGDPNALPFTLQLEEVTQDELPGFHSCAFAQWNGWWVIVGGRIGGLHGFFPITGFPENEANGDIWIINPDNGDAHHAAVATMTLPYPDQLKSTNPQFVQDGERLFICGGYGKESASGNFITFPILTAIQLPQLVAALTSGSNPSASIRQIQAPNLRVCGGEMEKMGDFFYLVGGHDFSGKYSDPNSGTFTQTYTNEIRKFKINSTTSSLSISEYSAIHNEQHLHRRDFTLAPIRQPNGDEGLCLYGGVFRPDAALPYYNPVYITENQPVGIDAQYEQIFSQYTCPAVPLFDSTDATMYTIFFAGLSAHYVDASTQTIAYDERVPFIRDISTFRRKSDGSSMEFVMPLKFDALLGTNMIFAAAETAPHYGNEVFQLHRMQQKTLLGYLFGGIKAEIPNITPSSASKRMFKLWLQPRVSTDAGAPAQANAHTRVVPNPFSAADRPVLETAFEVETALLLYSDGRTAGVFAGPAMEGLEQRLQSAPAGLYYLRLTAAGKQETVRLVKI